MSVGGKKVMSSFGWVALANYSNRFFRFITTLILAKLLSPEDFGMVAVASMVIELLYLMKDLGVSQALIYRQEDSELSVNTGLILVTGINTILFLAAAALSPLIARFYDDPDLMPVVLVLSSNLIWIGLKAAPEAKLRKNMEFRRLVVPNVVPVLIASAVSIFMALAGYGVWSLVIRALIVNVLGTLLIFRYARHRPSLKFSRSVARGLLSYGKFIVGTSVFLVLFYNLDKLFISRWGGVVALGYYTLAMRIASLPVSELSHVVCKVMFPVMSKLGNEPEKLRSTFLNTVKYSSLVAIPMSLGIAVFVPPVVELIYGDKWAPIIIPLQLLAFYALFRSLSSIIHETFKATGVPHLMQRYVIVRLVLLLGAVAPVMYFKGLNSMCAAMVLLNFLVTAMELFTISRRIELPVSSILVTFLKPAVVATVLVLGVHKVVAAAGLLDSLPFVVTAIIFIGVSYASIVLPTDKVLKAELRRLFAGGR
ncbi:MAG: lipopolysaccharide biosynthesis protein [Acidobacteria bacterium]|uniref:Lipopolysaccharide biosynthesis protein n=1 Tax=Candidatus Polarisedimenticola svalbardensis TaxID=2886004 RepID=A0A8J6Y1S8_9BACT|nr:lipopolysaccharide biosynthesis protein [Candidatus Polarisedimenticola svalbardensis]